MGENIQDVAEANATLAAASSKEALLVLRLSAITEAQKRARLALLIAALASAAILAAEWNSYFSWDRQWAEKALRPNRWGQNQLLEQQIKSWVDTNGVNLTIIGLRVSVSDAAVLGSFVLLIAAFYLCMTAKRENFEIGDTLLNVLHEPLLTRKRVFAHIRATAVFSHDNDSDTPIDDLFSDRDEARAQLAGSTHGFLIFSPALTILAIIITDMYFAFGYLSPWSGDDIPAFAHLTMQYKTQLVAMDLFALIFGIIVLRYCRFARKYQLATQRIIGQFGGKLSPVDRE